MHLWLHRGCCRPSSASNSGVAAFSSVSTIPLYARPLHVRATRARRVNETLFTRKHTKAFEISNLFRLIVLAWLLTSQMANLYGGGGPENVMLVVNGRSGSSMAIANYYRHLRNIPEANICYIDWGGSLEVITIDAFRKKILGPILGVIDKRKLSSQIDYIVYSSDFPYAVKFGEEVASQSAGKFTKGSITGLTYLAPLVMAKASYAGSRMNWYMRSVSPGGIQTKPTRGFRFERYWDRQGDVIGSAGMRYVLSAMLGYTGGRGNSIAEVIHYLQRSAAADHTYPTGTVYFSRNDDIRSQVRAAWFPLAVRELNRLGVKAEILGDKERHTPRNRKDVIGATTGRANLPWGKARNEILPGAICENFTSFGGVLAESGSQTPLTELLRHGAAGSTGTVVEPFALPDKFPHPFVHVHYARGCSLAEAVYQSVHGPFQLLLVGDPLCQPWAKPPQVDLEGIETGATVSGIVSITPRVVGEISAKHCELFLEGRRIAKIPSGEVHALDTTHIPDGYHELRVVGVANDLIEAQGRKIVRFFSKNHQGEIRFRVMPNDKQQWHQPLVIDAEAPAAKGIAVYANRQLLARSGGEKCRLVVKPLSIGMGPIQLQAIGLHDRRAELNVFSQPAKLEIIPPRYLSASPLSVGVQYEEGVRLSRENGTAVLKDTLARDWPQNAGIIPGEQFTLAGHVEAPDDGIYQLQVAVHGEIKVSVDNLVLSDMRNQRGVTSYALLPLAKGWHTLTAQATLDDKLQCRIRFGEAGCRSVGAPTFRVPL